MGCTAQKHSQCDINAVRDGTITSRMNRAAERAAVEWSSKPKQTLVEIGELRYAPNEAVSESLNALRGLEADSPAYLTNWDFVCSNGIYSLHSKYLVKPLDTVHVFFHFDGQLKLLYVDQYDGRMEPLTAQP